MSKLIVMTDLHVTEDGVQIIGLDPLARLRDGLAHAARHHPDADRLILTGDLTHHGTEAEYRRLRAALDGLPWPVSMTLGNHDRRAGFAAVFPDVARSPDGAVQEVVDIGPVRLILLDTLDEDHVPRHGGRLGAARLDWLRAALAGAEGRASLVFLHHPPFDTGFAGMDRIGLSDADDLLDVLRAGRAAHVFAGHIHRTIMASVGGIPVSVFKSPCHQMPMLLGAEGSGHSVDEPGAYGLVLARGGQVVVHTEDFTLPPQTVRTY